MTTRREFGQSLLATVVSYSLLQAVLICLPP